MFEFNTRCLRHVSQSHMCMTFVLEFQRLPSQYVGAASYACIRHVQHYPKTSPLDHLPSW